MVAENPLFALLAQYTPESSAKKVRIPGKNGRNLQSSFRLIGFVLYY